MLLSFSFEDVPCTAAISEAAAALRVGRQDLGGPHDLERGAICRGVCQEKRGLG
jgi:hypothetical protein